VVWEESIIMLPPHIRSVFLSATIPNAKEFGLWIAGELLDVEHEEISELRVHCFRPTLHLQSSTREPVTSSQPINGQSLSATTCFL
jgi:ATP-dependent RNA helicase DOB1